MGGGAQIQDDFARVIVEEGLKTVKAAENARLAGADTQEALGKFMKFVRSTVETEAKKYDKNGADPDRNPAITAFRRVRDGLDASADPQRPKTVDEYIKRLSQDYTKELKQVKKQEKLRSDVGQAAGPLSQYWNPEVGESEGKQQASIPAIIASRKTQL